MRAVRFRLRDFRSYERAEAELGEGLTVVVGPNGAGKTNLLEAIYFALTGRSCRTSNERELVRLGAEVTRTEAEVENEDGAHLLEVGFLPGEPKRLRVDGAPVERFGSDVPRPLTVVFLPERLELVRGGPSLRRAHIDQFAAALHPALSDLRSRYSRALAQRNALVARHSVAPGMLDPWDGELARLGWELMQARARAADLLAEPFARAAVELGLPERAELSYRPRSHATSADALRAELAERHAADLQRGFTAHGPHRDELLFAHGERPLRAFGSQGQQRVGLLALLLAEREVLLEQRGRAPLMLLDDVMSELDAERRQRLSELLRGGGQALITATEAEHVPGAADAGVVTIQVEGGALVPA
ncbi:MAG: replication and repair protein RecF [Thermoleophilaceae bacterium]|jgi:DNA replication and repair protein RecF|nr:replication and repair protein RecF [Thermoleophilaceae bacterium]